MSTQLSFYESALLSLSIPPIETSSSLLIAACAADPVTALHSPLAKSIFSISKDEAGVVKFGVKLPEVGQYAEIDLLAVGVAALHAFAQVNWTGPNLILSPLSLFELNLIEGITERELNDAAIESLAYCGEPVYHLTLVTSFLALALQIFGLVPSPFADSDSTSHSLLLKPYGLNWSLESIKIWRLRAGITWIKVLDEPVPLPPYVPSEATSLRHSLDSSSPDRSPLSLSLSLLGSLLSRSAPHSTAQKEASNLARNAADENSLEWELTGRMGKRTKWQVDEKTQLVVLARDKTSKFEDSTTTDSSDKLGSISESTPTETILVPEVLDLNDDTLLERTAFTISASTPLPSTPSTPLSSLDPSNQPSISSLSQSILLALSLSTLPSPTSILNLSADVLSTSQVTSFVARVLLSPQNWSVHSMALLLRCRAEAARSRTVERGVLQMQALVDQLRDGDGVATSALSSAVKEKDMAPARDRLEQYHGLALPPVWEFEKELATRYLGLGVSKSALEIFERLEMWEEVARCWISLERPEKGVLVIRDLLKGGREESDLVMEVRKREGEGTTTSKSHIRGGEKREAKLWCILGELENDAAHYQKAWEVSKFTSSRAQRSLGAVAWAERDYAKARTALRLALAINPLFPRTWFVLGCCEMKLEEWKGAQEAFGRCVALEDDDAESWSNLASCHLRRGEEEGDGDEIDGEEGGEEGEMDLEAIEKGVDSTGLMTSSSSNTTSVPTTTTSASNATSRTTTKLPFSRKRAAFHCLKQSIKHSYESWRIWVNYMVVAVDVGEMSEACRALGRIVEMRAAKEGEGSIDLEVLERLVDAVTRADEEEVVVGEGTLETKKSYLDPNVGRGLAPRVERLITTTILPRIANSARVYLAHARLLFYSKDWEGTLDAHLKAYRVGIAQDTTLEHDLVKFKDAAERVEEVVGMLENLGPREKKTGGGELVAKDWKFQARSLVRTFLGRTKEAFEDEKAWERLKELVAELK